jgi:hypothetical protein
MSQARSVTATFVALYTLSVSKTGSGGGTINGTDITCGATCSADYDDATTVTLTATASSGSRFTGWSGTCTGSSSCTVTMSQARNVTASFIAEYTLTVAKSGSGGGTVSSGDISCGTVCSAGYDEGSSVALTATPSPGSRFTGWSGACTGSSSCTITMSQARNVTANFIAEYTLTVTKTGSGGGTVSSGDISCGTVCSADYDDDAVVALTATATVGASFDGWTGACAGTGVCTVTMSQARTVTAGFLAAKPVTATKAVAGAVTGPAISCGAICVADYDDGPRATRKAKSEARSVTTTPVRLVRIEVTVAGVGVVGFEPNGMRCGGACARKFHAGTRVTLEALPKAGQWFVGWTGACSGRQPKCTVALSRARLARAHFAPELELHLQIPNWLVYHQPDERATIGALATWRGKPIGNAPIELLVTCPGRRSTVVLTTRKDGRVSYLVGATMPNSLRVYTCQVHGRVSANERTTRAQKPRAVGFIHPLWLESKMKQGKIVVRIWGRARETAELFAGGNSMGHAVIGRNGWVEITSPGIRHGDRLWVRGHHGHTTHVITA